MKRLLLTAFIMVMPVYLFSQGYYFGPENIYYENDTVKITLKNFTGAPQWQKSYDAINWEDIPGETSDSLFFIADSTTYFRARVTAGQCNSFFSDTASISVIKVSPKVALIDTSTTTLISDSAAIENGIFIYRTTNIEQFDTGKVLVSSVDSGYIRKVTRVTVRNDSVILETEQGTLEDVFEEAEVGDSIVLTLDGKKQGYLNGVPIPMYVIYEIEGAQLKSSGSGINLDNVVLFSGTVSGEDSTGSSASATLTVRIDNGSINFEPVFERKLKIKWFKLQEFKLAAGGEISLDLDLAIDCEVSYSYAKEITIAKYAFGPIMIGPVPMFIELSFDAGFEAGSSLYGTFAKGFDVTNYVLLGAAYERGDGWTGIWKKNGTFNNHPMVWDMGGNLSAKAYVKPQISVLIAKVAGPYMNVVPYLRFDGGVSLSERTWEYEFAGGLDANLGFKAEILGISLADYSTTLANWERIILSDNGSFANEIPALTTASVTAITDVTAICGGTVTDDGGASVTSRGVCWNITGTPTTFDSLTTDGAGSGSFISTLTGLSPATTYYVRAYATNAEGTAYGNEVSFTTDQYFAPSITADSVKDITASTATIWANVTSDGGQSITERGVCWNNTGLPSLADSVRQIVPGTGIYSTSLSGLTHGTLYYVRAYAINAVDTTYSNALNFSTILLYPPTVTTDSVNNILSTTATVWANVTGEGNGSVSERGVCWNKTGIPTYTDNIQSNGSGSGSYMVNMSGLESDSTYYVRAYAINEADTAFGDELSFTTLFADSLVLSTDSVSFITDNSVKIWANIISEGDNSVSQRGVCWNTEGSPTIEDNYEWNGSGEGIYFIKALGLQFDSTYYASAYAITSIDTTYGNEINFTVSGDTVTCPSTVTDYDGNTYNVVKIGCQCWTQENMNVSHYSDGTEVPRINSYSAWVAKSDTAKAWCYYDTTASYGSIYGALYTWNASVNGDTGSDSIPSGIQGICPVGWHVPSYDEWSILINYLGGSQVAGGKIKESGTGHWTSPNTGATNESGFTALPGGQRERSSGDFLDIGYSGSWWHASMVHSVSSWFFKLYYNSGGSGGGGFTYKGTGLSVRCIKD
ncbi:MAG: hypothetical protein JXB49_01690 [Bacteroidales bacterium]|nr:hypothetical protein [Bacteroidales bacterium]